MGNFIVGTGTWLFDNLNGVLPVFAGFGSEMETALEYLRSAFAVWGQFVNTDAIINAVSVYLIFELGMFGWRQTILAFNMVRGAGVKAD
jgi:hypothetical protein